MYLNASLSALKHQFVIMKVSQRPDRSLSDVKTPYQRVFEVHEAPLVQSEPAFLEAFRVL